MARALKCLLAMAALTAMLGVAPAPAASDCIPWVDARDLIREHGLVSGREIYGRIKRKTPAKIIKASLCREGGDFVYKVVLLGRRGKVTDVYVDARTGRRLR